VIGHCTDVKGFTLRVDLELRQLGEASTGFRPDAGDRIAAIDKEIEDILRAMENGFSDANWTDAREQRLRPLAYLADRPALHVIYRFKQRLCYLLLKKHKTRRQCQKLVPRFPRAVVETRQSGLATLVALGETLHSWSEEIGRMWRFTRSNGITEGFHNKMETITRQAYGFRNFENYRQRVQVLCG